MNKIYLNKYDHIEKIETSDGAVTKRHYGDLPNFLILANHEGEEMEMYDHKGKKLIDGIILLVEVDRIKYDVVNDYREKD